MFCNKDIYTKSSVKTHIQTVKTFRRNRIIIINSKIKEIKKAGTAVNIKETAAASV